MEKKRRKKQKQTTERVKVCNWRMRSYKIYTEFRKTDEIYPCVSALPKSRYLLSIAPFSGTKWEETQELIYIHNRGIQIRKDCISKTHVRTIFHSSTTKHFFLHQKLVLNLLVILCERDFWPRLYTQLQDATVQWITDAPQLKHPWKETYQKSWPRILSTWLGRLAPTAGLVNS
jgi:hypothetical protein